MSKWYAATSRFELTDQAQTWFKVRGRCVEVALQYVYATKLCSRSAQAQRHSGRSRKKDLRLEMYVDLRFTLYGR